MVRLAKNFAFTALLASAVAIPACLAGATSPAAAAQSTPASQTAAKPATPTSATPAQAASTPAANTTATQAPKPHHRKKKSEPVAEVPAAPPAPPTLEQQPPTAPQVSYRNGQLAINAPNSTLSSILRAVQSQTGATMDLPAGAGGERVAMQLGPGQPHDVLATLLNGSKFDYVILGVAGQPGAVQRIILTPKVAGGATTGQAANIPQPSSDEPVDDSPVADSGGESEYPANSDQAPVTPGAFRRPMGAPGAQVYQQQQQNNDQNPSAFGQNDPNVVKTPEQLMQELQQMQQQQQQYQDQLNPANQNPPQ